MNRTTIFALTLVGILVPLDSSAEVRALTNRKGDYQGTRIVGAGRAGGAWSPAARSGARAVLNPAGDINGDSWPSIAESNIAPHFPVVVWSRRSGPRFELAWSRWQGDAWRPISWLAPQSHGQGNNLDARVTFGPGARPHVSWWREQGGKGQVFLSVYLKSQWMAPFAVTDGTVDSRYPLLEVSDTGQIVVHYQTPEGAVKREVYFDAPVTITDDVNPLDCMTAGAVIAVSPQSP